MMSVQVSQFHRTAETASAGAGAYILLVRMAEAVDLVDANTNVVGVTDTSFDLVRQGWTSHNGSWPEGHAQHTTH